MDQRVWLYLVYTIFIRVSGFCYRRSCFKMVFHAEQEQAELSNSDKFRTSDSLSSRLGLLWVAVDRNNSVYSSDFQAG